jgi:hypothetical protein
MTPQFTLQLCSVDGKMGDEWEEIWNEDVVAYSSYYPGILVECLRKATKSFSEER